MAVIVLHASLATGAAREPAWCAQLLQALPYAKRLQVETAAADARRATLAGVALALLGAGRLGARDGCAGELRFPPAGKPVLEGGPRFSISHTSRHVACVISDVSDPGLDIEHRTAGATPAQWLKLQRWTATEATLKAAGQGVRQATGVRLAADLRSAGFLDRRYELQAIDLAPDTLGCYSSLSRDPLVIEEVSLASPAVSATLQRCLGRGAQGE